MICRNGADRGVGMMDTVPGNPQQRQSDAAPQPLRVFLNYRRDDAWAEAQLLYERLANRFSSENVFLDARTLQPGMKWFDEIKSHRASCDVLLALIGARWISILKARDQAAIVHPAEDYVRYEIQYALKPNSGIRVIPVLVGDDVPFAAELLPKSLQALGKIEVAQVRQKLFEDDVTRLISRLETIAREQPRPSPPKPPVTPTKTTKGNAVAPPPDDAHCELVLQQMVDRGNLVVLLGSRLPTGHADSPEVAVSLPNVEKLATSLAALFGVESGQRDLPEVAQYVYVTRGKPDLCRTVRDLLTTDCEPGPVHRFLARFPRTLEELGLEKRYQLIVSTSFDTALEQAFDLEEEPYDLAVYMANGRDQGKFVHFPSDGPPAPIADPNSYTQLPIGMDYELQRTLIVKIHGTVDGSVEGYRWKENYVITEDHYIDYLSRNPIESLVPVQILDKLRESHCLFLGYTVRDWNLRVFLKRIWEAGLDARSWAVDPDPDVLEKDLWAQFKVALYAADLTDYADLLQEWLAARAAAASA